MHEPVCVHGKMHQAKRSTRRAMEQSTGNQVLDWCCILMWHMIHAHIEIQDLFPHRREKTKVARLPCIFLCNLKLNDLMRAPQATKQGRCGLAYLEVNRPILDLNDDVVGKLSIERMEIVIGGLGAVILSFPPVKMVVVNKRAIEHDAAMRLERPSDGIRGVRRGAIVRGRTKLPLRVSLYYKPAKVRHQAVNTINLLAPPSFNPTLHRLERGHSANHF